ncbi:SulP family inorganic anion transporter [Piscinibacter sakaiensis]|uniref:SulP family inorganic anion transporter n=1 Tax=Piscinibacter sakaiensis TaxID=1547922 RepID=UPI003AAF5245
MPDRLSDAPAVIATQPVAGWRRDAVAAASGTLAALPSVLTQGLLAYAALAAAGPAIGIPAAFVSIVVGGIVFGLLGRGPMPAGAPTAAPVLILAGLVAQVVADPAFDVHDVAAVASLLALTAATVVGMGIVQLLIAAVGLVKLAKFVPQPVLAGFMNGVALLIVLTQLPLLLGWPDGSWAMQGWSAIGGIQTGTLLVALLTIAAIHFAPRITRRVPASFVGLLVGIVAWFAIERLLPSLALGPLTGSLPQALPRADLLAPWFGPDQHVLLQRHALAALTTAALLAVIGTLTMVLDGLALDQALGARTDARRELLALGAANIASGCFAGLPVLLHRTRALAITSEGGRAPQALILGTALFAVLALAGGPMLAMIPKVVMAAIMVMIAWSLADQWTHQLIAQWWHGLRTPDLQLNLAVVAVVAVCTLVFGLLAGVAIGALLAIVMFVRSMNRSLLRNRYDATALPSRRIYPPDHEALLRRLRQRIVVLELEGALFFGSADRLADEVEALPRSCRCIVLDFKRITLIDASGAVVLAQIGQRLQARGVVMRLAAVASGNRHGQALHEFAAAALSPDHWFADVDQAIEAAEAQLLAEHDTGSRSKSGAVELSACSLADGLDAAQLGRLAALLERRELTAGELLFRQGESGDRLYVLLSGSVSVVSAAAVSASDPAPARPALPRQRYVSFSPGMMLGETAMLDGGGRTADAVADLPSVVLSLSRRSLDELDRQDPLLCSRLYRNIARHLSERLRAAAAAWRSSSG